MSTTTAMAQHCLSSSSTSSSFSSSSASAVPPRKKKGKKRKGPKERAREARETALDKEVWQLYNETIHFGFDGTPEAIRARFRETLIKEHAIAASENPNPDNLLTFDDFDKAYDRMYYGTLFSGKCETK